jgi:hypothetical protein
MWSLGRPAGTAGAIPSELVAGLAGEGRGVAGGRRGQGPWLLLRQRASGGNGERQRGQGRGRPGSSVRRRVGRGRTAARILGRGHVGSADSAAPRRACCLGKEPHLGRRAGGSDAEVGGAGARQARSGGRRRGGHARERALSSNLLGVPLFDRDFLPKFE